MMNKFSFFAYKAVHSTTPYNEADEISHQALSLTDEQSCLKKLPVKSVSEQEAD